MQKVVLVTNPEEITMESGPGKLIPLLREGWRICSVDDSPRLRALVFVLDEPAGAPTGTQEEIVAEALRVHREVRSAPAPVTEPAEPPPRDGNAPAAYVPFAMRDDTDAK